MKKVFLFFALGFAMMAYASTYNYLVFTSQTGTTTVFTISNLTINVSGNELSVTNNDGTVNLVLTDLVSMQFSKDKTITSLENVINADELVHVYSVTGASLGTYNSMVEAAKKLSVGTYILSNGKLSQTIVVK